jgi:hypothetical protein
MPCPYLRGGGRPSRQEEMTQAWRRGRTRPVRGSEGHVSDLERGCQEILGCGRAAIEDSPSEPAPTIDQTLGYRYAVQQFSQGES